MMNADLLEEKLRTDARMIFDEGLRAADPGVAVRRFVRLAPNGDITAGSSQYRIQDIGRIFIVGAGKAAAPMTKALEELLGDALTGGVVTTKYGHGMPLDRVRLREAGHPVPDEEGLKGAREIMDLLSEAREGDLIFCLVSGGGSALMPMPVEGITLKDKQSATGALLACGATIHEINAIRKHISAVKGGKLARAAHPAKLISLILSDVVGDDLDVIASGPTVPDRSTFADCIEILAKYAILDVVPPSVRSYLEAGVRGESPETVKAGDKVFDHEEHFIIGSASISLAAAKQKAESLGYHAAILSSCIEGETREVAKALAAMAKEELLSSNPLQRPACLISGGETTVTITGSGLGGRNMEFVLSAAMELSGWSPVCMLSGGTDGTDGPTDAAGAVADGRTISRAMEKGLRAPDFLKGNDSYHFFESLGDLLITGPTMTNVMDLRIILAG
ncbi:MAG: glycerate kinase [Deltaproteobacteria bacterium]|nr:glycerate kinase [Deltaproteobacteria bacterium]